MLARTVMVQGTTSSAGKSILTTALCRIFKNKGYRVAPFKSQNMSLNSHVSADGGEIGRSQAVQAEAAEVPSSVHMNPILLKPEADSHSQVVVLGKSRGRLNFRQYHALKPELRETVRQSLNLLRSQFDLVVIEGAGSPAEINLNEHEIVNMFVAREAGAPVLLVGDIDRGGVFAAFVGTLELLAPDDRARVAAFVVNRFRGNVALLQPGLDMLTARTNVPVLGVIPYLEQLRIADEDSLSLEQRLNRPARNSGLLDIVVLRAPQISNYDDFEPLENEPGVQLRFVDRIELAAEPDLLVLAGSKNTVSDLEWLRRTGFAEMILKRAEKKLPILGVCGGCQMLGRRILDPEKIESTQAEAEGLGLLPISTRFENRKTTAQVAAQCRTASFLCSERDAVVAGYEIHMGVLHYENPACAAFSIQTRNGEPSETLDGAVSACGSIVGTLIHGIFRNEAVRLSLLRELSKRRGRPYQDVATPFRPQNEYDRLAGAVLENIDYPLLERIIGLGPGVRR